VESLDHNWYLRGIARNFVIYKWASSVVESTTPNKSYVGIILHTFYYIILCSYVYIMEFEYLTIPVDEFQSFLEIYTIYV